MSFLLAVSHGLSALTFPLAPAITARLTSSKPGDARKSWNCVVTRRVNTVDITVCEGFSRAQATGEAGPKACNVNEANNQGSSHTS